MRHCGVLGECEAIDKLIDRLTSSGTLFTEISSEEHVLAQIKDAIVTPSKYDIIVKCLKPCLNIDKVESDSPC